MKQLLFRTLTTQKLLLLSLKVFKEVYFYWREFVLGTLLELVVFRICFLPCQLCINLASMGKDVLSENTEGVIIPPQARFSKSSFTAKPFTIYSFSILVAHILN